MNEDHTNVSPGACVVDETGAPRTYAEWLAASGLAGNQHARNECTFAAWTSGDEPWDLGEQDVDTERSPS